MDRKKAIYIGLLLIITVIVSITYFSYAFFTNRSEQHGKLNIVTGTLNYKIKSADLNNKQISIAAKTEKQINLEITSLNDISSKYELYYNTATNGVQVKYSTLGDLPSGTIASNGKKNLILQLSNTSDTNATITFGVQGGFTYNNLVLENGNQITALSQITVTFDTNKLKKVLTKKQQKSVIRKHYKVNNWPGLLNLLKESGVEWKEFLKYVDVSEDVDEAALEKLVELGEVKPEKIVDCSNATVKTQYYKLTEK